MTSPRRVAIPPFPGEHTLVRTVALGAFAGAAYRGAQAVLLSNEGRGVTPSLWPDVALFAAIGAGLAAALWAARAPRSKRGA